MFVEIVCVARQSVLLSCLCFAEMLIYFRFGEFWANSRSIYVLFLGKVMPNFCMTLMHARIFIINLFIITVQTFMVVSGMMVARWLRLVVAVSGAGHERK